ncbi:MAG: NAD-dependent epimerase/dehydratase family protein [Deltaproteobacteria bacterium]|nr:NAD-dependent epimerase/dehydratase family protein [Deltaproteobacteria bacterium]
MPTVPPRRALVTGASGHLGANLTRELLDQGWEVIPFVRVTSRLAGLEGLDVRVRYGDVLDRASLDVAMEGVDVVFHTAAVHRLWSKDPATEIITPALEGTRNVLTAAAAAGIARVVHTSSCNTVGFTTDSDRPFAEDHYAEDPQLDYVRGKVESERLALRLGAELGIEVVVLNPTGILGPHDHRMTPTMGFARDILNGGPMLPGAQNLVHVRDVARAHVLAADRGEPGERYIIGGTNVDTEELGRHVFELTGNRPSVLRGPKWLFLALGWLMETMARIRGGDPALTPALVRDALGRSPVFDVSKARDGLGFEGRGPREVLEDTLRWLESSGHGGAELHGRPR